jgi:hypothetical protein
MQPCHIHVECAFHAIHAVLNKCHLEQKTNQEARNCFVEVLEEPINLSGLSINVHIEISGCCGEAGNGLDVCRECVAVLC